MVCNSRFNRNEWNFETDTIGSESMVLYAKWSAYTYDISFDLNGGEGDVDTSSSYETGAVIDAPVTPTRDGYEFVGWNTSIDGTGVMWDFTTDTMPAYDLELYAIWDANPYGVTFDLNGGEGDVPNSQVVLMDELVTQPSVPVRTGYTFLGWSLSSTSTTSMWDFNNDTMPSKDITLYAQWGVDTYDVVFDVNGGESNDPSDQVVGFGELISEPSTPVKTGYTFVGWNTMADGSGDTWQFDVDTMPEEDLKLYAQWELNEYVLTYDTVGAVTPTPSTEVVPYGEYAPEPEDPLKTGYEFVGWNSKRSGDGLFAEFEIMTMPAKDVELYAVWSLDTPVVNPLVPGDICISGSGATPGATIVVTDVYGNTVGTVIVNSDGTWEFCDEIVTDVDDIFVNQVDPDGNTSETIEINKPNSIFNVFFNTNGATSNIPNNQEVKIGKLVIQPAEPIKLGYTFEGWYTNNGVKWNFALDTMKAQDMTLNAEWSLTSPVVNPIKPGDTCITGSGAPGSTLYIYDSDGNIIGTTTVDASGMFSYCDDSLGSTGEITVELVDPDGNVSSRVRVFKPGGGVVNNVLPETGVNTLETLLSGMLMVVMSIIFVRKLKR